MLARLPGNGGMVMATFVPEFLNPAALDAVRGYKDEWGKMRKGLNAGDYRAARDACLKGWNQDGVAYVCDHLDYFRKLVGEDHIGVVHQRPGDRHTLLLTAGKLFGIRVDFVEQSHEFQHAARGRPGLRGRFLFTTRGASEIFSSTVRCGNRL